MEILQLLPLLTVKCFLLLWEDLHPISIPIALSHRCPDFLCVLSRKCHVIL